MNNVNLMGRLTRDPEVQYTQSGKCVVGFTIAVDKFIGGKKEADFIPYVYWDKTAEAIGNNIGKGDKVGVSGRLQTREYENKAGQKVKVFEVLGNTVDFPDKREAKAKPQETSDFGPEVFPDDDVPF